MCQSSVSQSLSELVSEFVTQNETPAESREQLKLETSNLAYRLATTVLIKNAKLGKRGREGVT